MNCLKETSPKVTGKQFRLLLPARKKKVFKSATASMHEQLPLYCVLNLLPDNQNLHGRYATFFLYI